jgi:hypothetical protein
MLVAPTRARFLAGAFCAIFVVPACSPASSAPGGGGPSGALPACPATFAAVAGASCSIEGQSCTYLAPCTTFASNATCVCTGGSFSCTGFGDASTSCPVLSTTEQCPATEKSASGLFCSDLGLVCTYPSVCPGIPTFDSCQCIGARSADEKNHFECSGSCILLGDATAPSPEASPPDAAATDADDDARSISPADSAPPPDGAGDR